MAHFKRGRSKDRRAGCLWCKPHKSNAFKDTASARRAVDQRTMDRMASSEEESLFEEEEWDDD